MDRDGRPRPASVIQFTAGLVVLGTMLLLATEPNIPTERIVTLGIFALVLMTVPVPRFLRPGGGDDDEEEDS